MSFLNSLTNFPILVRFAKIVPKRMRSDLTEVTHTGQVWSKDDYRNVRFTNAKRWVNKTWAMKLAHQIEPTICSERVVFCDGDGPLGHPKVYMCLDKPSTHYCHYCLKSFIKAEYAPAVLAKRAKK